MNITESEYFFYGSAASNDEFDEPVQYGLYEPISDRFVIVSKFLTSLQAVLTLFSGRVSLRLCRLDRATNFSTDLIDNSCCTNWTIGGDRAKLPVTRSVEEGVLSPVFRVEELIPAKPLDGPELIVDNQEYLFATYKWITNEECEGTLLSAGTNPFGRAEVYINSFIDLPFNLSEAALIYREIHNIIYCENDFTIARQQVEKILNQ